MYFELMQAVATHILIKMHCRDLNNRLVQYLFGLKCLVLGSKELDNS